MCTYEFRCPWRSEEEFRAPKAGVTGGHESPNLGAGTLLWILKYVFLVAEPPLQPGPFVLELHVNPYNLNKDSNFKVSLENWCSYSFNCRRDSSGFRLPSVNCWGAGVFASISKRWNTDILAKGPYEDPADINGWIPRQGQVQSYELCSHKELQGEVGRVRSRSEIRRPLNAASWCPCVYDIGKVIHFPKT